MVCPLAGENGGNGEGEGTAQPLVQITLVKQAGGTRGQIYYPYISFRVAKTLQVSNNFLTVLTLVQTGALIQPGDRTWCQ